MPPNIKEAGHRLYQLMHAFVQVLRNLNIPFKLHMGLASKGLPKLVKEHSVSAVVCDFAPLRVPMGWVKDVRAELDKLCVPLVQVSRSCIRGIVVQPI